MSCNRTRKARVLIWTLAAALCCASPARSQQRPLPEQQPRFRIDVNLITLRFSVVDAAGKLIRTLRQEDFVIREEGVDRPIAVFEAPRASAVDPTSLAAAFLIDVSGSTLGVRNEQILASQRFLSNLPVGTPAGVYAFTDHLLPLQKLTTDRKQVLRGFEKVQRHRGRTAIYDSFLELVQELALQRREGSARKVVIVISDGRDDRSDRLGAAVDAARSAGITVYSVLVPSSPQTQVGETAGTQDGDEAQMRAYEQLALQTGGTFHSGYETLIDFEGTLAEISGRLLGGLYTVGFYTEDPNRERNLRNISVELRTPGLRVSGLFSNLPQQLRTKKAFLAALFSNEKLEGLTGELSSRFQEIGAEIDLLSSQGDGGMTGAPFRIKVSPYSFFHGKTSSQGSLGVIAVLVEGSGREVTRLRDFLRVDFNERDFREKRGIIYTNKLSAAPGIYRLRVALLDMEDWRLTTFDHMVEIR
ncbi:MAG: VWA domain-containing protein [Acidobacteriota bacterium]